MKNLVFAALVGAAALHLGCDNRAVVKVSFSNATPTTSTQALAAQPSADETTPKFSLRLTSIYLSEQVDDGMDVGRVSEVWARPGCGNLGQCEFFDFSRATSAVNRELASDPVITRPGTYRYVRMSVCANGEQLANIQYKAKGDEASHELWHDRCAVTSQRFDPPIVLEAGEAFEINLEYNLSNVGDEVRSADDHGGRDCHDEGEGHKRCLSMPAFTPSIKRL